MSKGVLLKTRNDLRKARKDGKYLLIIKRPQSKSRIHKGDCRSVAFAHILDYGETDAKLGMGKAKQQYFAFDNLEDANDAYPAHVRPIDPHCHICIKKQPF